MKIFCSGIGGIGLSAYAAYQRASGHDVAGSDRVDSALISDLRSQGIDVSLEQDGSTVSDEIDMFVYTLALPDDHPELVRARALGIPRKTYFEVLGDLLRQSGRRVIAVCGTHGKSSTTAMAAKVMIDAGMDPSVILGTKTEDLQGRNWRLGRGGHFLVEACEYRRSFLNIDPDIIMVTNCVGDHFDAFRDMEDYRRAFGEFIGRLQGNGVLVCVQDMYKMCKKYIKSTYNIHIIDASHHSAPALQVPGRHMRENATLVLALADVLGISDAEESLKAYRGCWRRTEVKGISKDNVLVIDDYGHHPNEVRATLAGLKESYPDWRLVCVFQPHTHDRTLKLYDQFLTAFDAADVVVIPNVYDARAQRDGKRVDVSKLLEDIAKGSGVRVVNGKSFEGTVQLLKEEILQPGDTLVTMGAGDVWRVGERLMGYRGTPGVIVRHAPPSPSPCAR